jgi:hypothetical protein
MDLIDQVRALADECYDRGELVLAQSLHAAANLGGKPPAAVVLSEPGLDPVVVVGPDLPAVLASLGVRTVDEYNDAHRLAGGSLEVVRDFRFVE